MKRSSSATRPAGRSDRGFTLVELLIAVAMLAILAALAYPSYMSQVHKSRRLDALVALLQVQQAQERWRANHSAFASELTLLGLPALAGAGYRIAISASAAHGYTAVATAVALQASDTACASLSLAQNAGDTHYSSTGTATSQRCWNR